MELNYRLAKSLLQLPERPQFMHDCSECIFVGVTDRGSDVWIHTRETPEGGDTIMLRTGNEGADYSAFGYEIAANIGDEQPGSEWRQAVRMCDALELSGYATSRTDYLEDVLFEAGQWKRIGELDVLELESGQIRYFRDQHGNVFLKIRRCNLSWELCVLVDNMSWANMHCVEQFNSVVLIARAIANELNNS